MMDINKESLGHRLDGMETQVTFNEVPASGKGVKGDRGPAGEPGPVGPPGPPGTPGKDGGFNPAQLKEFEKMKKDIEEIKNAMQK